jgi:hypothetical protein
MVLGIIGGVIGLFIAGIAIIAGAASTDHNVATGFLLLLLSVAGIVGAALSQAKPVAAAITMGVAGVGGFVLVTGWWIVAGPLLIAGAVMAYMGRPVATVAPTSAQEPVTSGSTPTSR